VYYLKGSLIVSHLPSERLSYREPADKSLKKCPMTEGVFL
jgi:hypothetical protein